MARKDKIAAYPGDYRLEGSYDVGKEPRGVIVRGIQREPAGRMGSIPEPLDEEPGLAETGWLCAIIGVDRRVIGQAYLLLGW